MRIQFNTGCMYSSRGQRIICEVVEEPDRTGIIFNDIDRGIDGFIPMARVPKDKFALEEQTIHNYNYGNYTHDPARNLGRGVTLARNLGWVE